MPTREPKPIKVFYSPITQKFYATQHYKERFDVESDGTAYQVTGKKYDVTDDIGFAVARYDIQFEKVAEDER